MQMAAAVGGRIGEMFMDDMKTEKRQEMEIDSQRVLGAVLKRFWVISIVAVLGAVLSFLITFFLITPKYESSAMFYVNNNSLSLSDVGITSSDLTASQKLVDSYIVILKTRDCLDDVIDYADVNRDYEDLEDMITAEAVNATEIFRVTVTSPDPVEAEKIASAIAYILPNQISDIIEGTSAKIVDTAMVPTKPSSPSYVNNTILGFLAALVLCATIVVLQEVFDVTIRTEEDVTQRCPHPILAAVPDMSATTKGGYGYYYYGYGNSRPKDSAASKKNPTMIGGEISFAASEAYKLLRTKLQFSFAGEEDCRILGVSSAMAGEGKSMTAINLAYSLSQLDKKVLLIDCDMRRPSLAVKLNIAKAPGLSNYLSGQSEFRDLIQACGIPNDQNAFGVVTAGRNPPNPIELLSSEKMSKLLSRLRGSFDYVILDLPPVGEVSDALAIAKETDGMLLVVRQNYCNRPMLAETVRQFEFVDAKVLGVIFNAASEHSGGYGKKYYKKYSKYNKYGSYGGAYAKAYRRAAEKNAAAARAEAKERSESEK